MSLSCACRYAYLDWRLDAPTPHTHRRYSRDAVCTPLPDLNTRHSNCTELQTVYTRAHLYMYLLNIFIVYVTVIVNMRLLMQSRLSQNCSYNVSNCRKWNIQLPNNIASSFSLPLFFLWNGHLRSKHKDNDHNKPQLFERITLQNPDVTCGRRVTVELTRLVVVLFL